MIKIIKAFTLPDLEEKVNLFTTTRDDINGYQYQHFVDTETNMNIFSCAITYNL